MLLFRQLWDPVSSTYTYLLADPDTREAALVDPVVEELDAYVELLRALRLRLVFTLETHVHADHVTAAGHLRERFGSRSVVHADAGAACADVKVRDGDHVRVGKLDVEVRYTPGHTNGDVSYVLADRVLTGDCLLINGCGRTDFQGGDAGRLYDSVHAQLFTLPPDTLVFPAHDYNGNTVSTIRQEMAKNARLGGGRSREDFVRLMGELRLPYPKKIDVALPANQACGRLPQAAGVATRVSAMDAFARIARFKVVDVRDADEFHGDLGHVPGAALVPLATLAEAAQAWPRDVRLLLVCRTGMRSASACETLTRLGFADLHDLEGGMTAWTQLGLPVER
ncbi:MAG: MBL fold metallo-hydrolase [Myxococcota bacterium]